MQPTSSREFLRVASQRLETAEVLLRANLTLDAQYIGGYTIECALKSLILVSTPEQERGDRLKQITSGSNMHNFEILLRLLRDQSVRFPKEFAFKFRRYPWSTDLRYETGRKDSGETLAFLKLAKAIYDWVQEKLP